MPRLVALALLLCSGCSFDPSAPGTDDGTGSAPALDAPAPVACDHEVYETEWNGHFYYLTEPMSWTAARDHCTATGGYLLTLETREEDQAAYNYLLGTRTYVWIGLQDSTATDDYRWIRTNEPPAYTNWPGDTKPTEAARNCVDMKVTLAEHNWYAWDCNVAEAAVCECDH